MESLKYYDRSKRVITLIIIVLALVYISVFFAAIFMSKGEKNESSWAYDEDARFIPIEDEYYKGNGGGVYISTFYDVETKVMYVLTKGAGGGGVGFTVMVDEEGNPLLYEGAE